MNKKYLVVFLGLFLITSMFLVSAQGTKAGISNNYITSNNYNTQKLSQIRTSFQNRYQFQCPGNCTYSEKNDKLKLEVKSQVRVMSFFANDVQFNLPTKDTYILNKNSEIVNARHNLWSLLFNREKVKK